MASCKYDVNLGLSHVYEYTTLALALSVVFKVDIIPRVVLKGLFGRLVWCDFGSKFLVEFVFTPELKN